MFSYARISNPILCFNTGKKPRGEISAIEASTAADFAQGRRLLRRAEALATAANDDAKNGAMISLPEAYSSPEAALLLAKSGSVYAGCVGLRKLAAEIAEIERLFVAPEHRGKGIGRELVRACIDAAREKGYRSVRFVCPDALAPVLAYCRRLGFAATAPYKLDPGVVNPVYMELAL